MKVIQLLEANWRDTPQVRISNIRPGDAMYDDLLALTSEAELEKVRRKGILTDVKKRYKGASFIVIGFKKSDDVYFRIDKADIKESQIVEGKYVVKNKDGVEKRFADPKSPQALAFIASGKKAERAALKKDIADATAELKKNDLDVVWDAISRIQDWEALDWIDLVKMQAIPYLVKTIKAKPGDYSNELKTAINKAARNAPYDDFDPLLKFFDKACKDAGEGGWKKYARSMASYGRSAR